MNHQDSINLTRMLGIATEGTPGAAEELLPLVYEELRRVAGILMNREKPGQTLQATALVHEACLRLIAGPEAPSTWENRKHFFNAAALTMRRILVDRHRRVNRDRHGGGRRREDFAELEIPVMKEIAPDQFEHMDRVLDELKAHNARWSEIVHLRFFVGLTIEQTSELLQLSPATVKSDWQFARAWLKLQLRHEFGDGGVGI